MMEWNPGEAIKNNVFGTKTVADLATSTASSAS
jgi:FlaA1/EpsC-like NDP-sugar epimerase